MENGKPLKEFDEIIREQRDHKPDEEKILQTVNALPVENMVEYLDFLEHKYAIKPSGDVAKTIFLRFGISDLEFIEAHSGELTYQSLERLSRLIFAKSDKLLDTYLYIPYPDNMINEYALFKAKQINKRYKGHFRNALELIKLGIELNKGKNPDELFTTFLSMKNHYYEKDFPPVDINTFFKLVIPILK